MTKVKEMDTSLLDLLQWDILQHLSILKDNTTTLQDVEQMVKLFQDTVETELKYIIDPKKQIDILDSHIDKQAKWLATRQFVIMLLDGKAKDFQEDIDEKMKVLDMMGTSLPQPLHNSLDFLSKENEIKVSLEYNETEQRALLSVSSPDEVNNKNNFDLEKTFTDLSLSLKELDIDLEKELPNYFGNSESSLFSALTSNQEKNALQIVLRPLLMVQVKRMFWGYLNERRLEIMDSLSQKYELPVGQNQLPQNTDWHYLIESNKIDNREIKISSKYLPYVAGKLQPYFSEEDFKSLLILLEGNPLENIRISFDKEGSMLGYFFKVLHKADVIKSEKKNTELWLEKYFDYQNRKTKTSTPFTRPMAHEYLTRDTPLKGKTTIDTSDLEEFKIKNNLK